MNQYQDRLRTEPTGPYGARHGAEQLDREPLRWRDQTIRANEHGQYGGRSVGREWNESEFVPMLAVGAGAMLVGWLLGNVGRSNSSSEDRWPERARTSGNGKIPIDETRDLIASNKVEGTAVYDRAGERLGSVYNFMVRKRSGQVAYAVLRFGGWLGMGERYHPLPWGTLTYDTDRGGYVVSLPKEQLRNAPSHALTQDVSSDPDYWRDVRDYWS
jgi:hypothetical protein